MVLLEFDLFGSRFYEWQSKRRWREQATRLTPMALRGAATYSGKSNPELNQHSECCLCKAKTLDGQAERNSAAKSDSTTAQSTHK